MASGLKLSIMFPINSLLHYLLILVPWDGTVGIFILNIVIQLILVINFKTNLIELQSFLQ